jgi:hypothetical protein
MVRDPHADADLRDAVWDADQVELETASSDWCRSEALASTAMMPRTLPIVYGRVLQQNGAAQESNLPSVGLRRRTGFEGLPSEVQLATEAPFWRRFSALRSC